jgi:superfamily II DNA helicase RecQ
VAIADADDGLAGAPRAAGRREGVPAFVVFHDSITSWRHAPQSHGELASIKGLGPAKLERYGDDLLAVIEAAS